jgi:hypothetical protein
LANLQDLWFVKELIHFCKFRQKAAKKADRLLHLGLVDDTNEAENFISFRGQIEGLQAG